LILEKSFTDENAEKQINSQFAIVNSQLETGAIFYAGKIFILFGLAKNK